MVTEGFNEHDLSLKIWIKCWKKGDACVDLDEKVGHGEARMKIILLDAFLHVKNEIKSFTHKISYLKVDKA